MYILTFKQNGRTIEAGLFKTDVAAYNYVGKQADIAVPTLRKATQNECDKWNGYDRILSAPKAN